MAQLKPPLTAEDHVQGPEDAGATLVEYGDYECPHCAVAHTIVQRLQKHFAQKLRFAFRNFPLSQIHPHAESAAEVAEFAAAQGKFWEMHHRLFENQTRLGGPLYAELAADCGLSSAALRKALEDGTYKGRVRGDFSGGVRSGVNGTPTFFINGRRHDGSFEYEGLLLAIEQELASPGTKISA